MIKKLIVLIFVTISCIGYSQNKNINFEHGTFEEALVKANKENKLVFVDCYTTWCGPCKQMDKYVFTEESVYTLFNNNYINVKMDMEKGEGIELAQYYSVDSYPTLLFLNSNGDIVNKTRGLMTEEILIANAKEAMSKKISSN